MSNVRIREIEAFPIAPNGIDLVVVRVQTDQDGLYGLGCATFTQRYEAVVTAIEKYIRPIFVGKCVDNIEDIWQTAMGSSYWRNGPVLNNAISGLDEALWDIKGKMAGMPVYQLLGGKTREAAAVYRHADGRCPEEVEENVRKYVEEGYRYVRCQLSGYGGGDVQNIVSPENAPAGVYFDPEQYVRSVVKMFEHLDATVGNQAEFLHDIHERLQPVKALRLAKELEPFHLFFLEDALAPEQVEWFEKMRMQTTTPIAMGELFVNPMEWSYIITNRLIDYIRVHLSMIGGLTPARKLAALCEHFGVRTAFHGPGDLTPVGAAAQLHLDLAVPNFGIQEFSGFSELEQEIFPGCPQVRNGYLYANEKPGFGIDFDEKLAMKYASKGYALDHDKHWWLFSRTTDGTAVRP